jgi:hypothetical protein
MDDEGMEEDESGNDEELEETEEGVFEGTVQKKGSCERTEN